MKTALLYSSKYGSTEKVAKQLADKLNFPVDIVNLANKPAETNNYDTFIIGLPVLAENTTMDMRRFLGKNLDSISDKITAVFLLCWNTDKWNTYMEKLFADKLPDNCIKACIGGEFNFDKMMDIEKNIVKEITGIKENCSKISQEEMDRFASEINTRMTVRK